MDNLSSTGTSESDDIFSYVPPNMMFDGFRENKHFSSKEEQERYEYHRQEKLEKEDLENKIGKNNLQSK